MTSHVVALFSQSFPRPLPQSWRSIWQTHLSRWMNWLLATFFFMLPWIVIPSWFDSGELPKALLAIGIMSIWLVLRGVYAWLRSSGAREPRRWSAFALWMGAIGLVTAGSWVFSVHRSLSWLGNHTQISSSFLIVLIALWLMVAVRDGLQRSPEVMRPWVRAWFIGMCVAIFGSLLARITDATWVPRLFQSGNPLELLLTTPLLLAVGLMLLTTRGAVSAPLTSRRLWFYRLSHGLLALVLLDVLMIGLVVDLQLLWLVVVLVAIATFVLVAAKHRRVSLAGFLSLMAIVCALVGLGQFDWPGRATPLFATPQWITRLRSATKLDQLTEILPSQALSWKIVAGTLKEHPLFGAGPGAWPYAAEYARPLEFNKTALWAVRFPRAGSALATSLAEYGLLPSLVAAAFLLVLIVGALRRVKQNSSGLHLWPVLLVVSGVLYAGLRPMGVVPVLSLAFFVGLLAAQVFVEGRVMIPQLERRSVRQVLVAGMVILALSVSISGLRRAAAAELLTSYAPYALSLARHLNPADDFTFAREAAIYLQQAQLAGNEQQVVILERLLDRTDQLLQTARTRNPSDAEHVSLALQSVRLRAAVNPDREEQVLVLAAELDRLRPTDPNGPLSVFGVERERMARETRWVEQGQGREKEEALRRENQAKTAADKALREAIRRKPDYLPALYAQAAWLAQLGQIQQSITALETLATQNPTSPEISLPLALLYRRNQEPMKAAAVLQRLSERLPDELEYQWQLALALIQAKQFDAATTVLQRLVAQNPRTTRYQAQLKEVLRERAAQLVPVIVPSATSTASTTTTSSTSTRSTTNRRVRRTIR